MRANFVSKPAFLSSAAMVAALLLTTAASAQTASVASSGDQAGTGDIIVTAQRRSERLQDVPVSVTAVDAAMAQQMGVRRIKDINLVAPSVSFTDQPGVMALYIRGIGSQYQNAGIEGSVAVYMDGAYIPRAHGLQSLLNIVDPGTLQVLRGPQGTLYGRNATGGVVLINSAQPTSNFEGVVSAEYGRFNHTQIDGVLNAPLSDTLSVRFAGRFQRDDGYIHNLATGRELGGGRNYVARGTIRWQPSADVDVVAGAEYNRSKNRKAISQLGAGAPVCLVCQTNGQQPADGFYETNQNDPAPWTNRIFRTFLRANVTVGQFDFTSVTTYFRDLNSQVSDSDFTASPAFYYGADEKGGRTYSQSFQIASDLGGPFDFLAGVDYLHDRGSGTISLRGSDYQAVANAYGAFPVNTSTVLTKSLSGFLEGSYKITQQLKFTAGGRYTQDNRTATFTNNSGFIGLGAPATGGAEKSFSAFTPRFVLSWDNGPTNIYYSFTRGFKAGGLNTPATFSVGTVKPEKVFSHEVGLKNSWMGGRLKTNISTFYYKNKNLVTQIINPTGGGSRLENAGGVEGYGVELEASTNPIEGLNLGGSLSYVHTEFFDYTNASQVCYDPARVPRAALFPCPLGPKTNLNGVRAPNAPKWQAALHGSYDFPIGTWGGNLAGIVSYRSSFDFVANAAGYDLHYDSQKGYILANFSGYVSPPGGNIRLGFYLDNAFDKEYAFTRVSSQPYGINYTAAPPRTYGVRAEYRF